MKIGIDARLIHETGVGRYIRNLIAQLALLDTGNEYVVFLRQKGFDEFIIPNNRWKKILADVAWHTIVEQFVMSKMFYDARLDLVHIPYHNPPIFYSGVMVITIHDLTILHFNTGKATMLPQPLYQLKRLGYWFELWIGLRKTKKIIAVSEATKREIIDHFRIDPKKIIVTYEGAGIKKSTAQRLIPYPYILYVGNAYPHKNLENLLAAAPLIKQKLVLVGTDDFFYRKLREMSRSDNVVFFGSANDAQLANLYANADALVFPSLMEGFGLPALEALAHNCPVIVSHIPVFHEILGDVPKYFDPHDEKALAECLKHPPVRSKLFQEKAAKLVQKYSWQKMAKETLAIYRSATL